MKVKKFLVVIVIVMLVMGICFSPKKKTYSQEVALGKEKLAELSERDLAGVESSISASQKRKRANKGEDMNFKQIFENTIIMGDSMAMALLDYQLLNSNQVVSQRGRTILNNEDDIAVVKGLSPRVLFLQYGLNDLGAFRGNTDLWISSYEEMITDLRASLPNTTIYVVAITPLTAKGQTANPSNPKYPEFNEALEEMCKRLDIKFIDPGFLVDPNDESQYQADGIHPGYFYFPQWLTVMVDEANL